MKYTEEEIDAVIDHLDLGFMRNRIKNSDSDTESIMNSFTGACIVLRIRLKHLVQTIIAELKSK